MAAAAPLGGRVNAPAKVIAMLALLSLVALPARAGTYFVTVAGLGGEPDYEQRFTAAATDLDHILKSSGSEAHIYTLIGANASRQHIQDTLGQIARDAKPDDDFVLILIGHGTFDGVEYKFNLPGPDVSASELASWCDRIPAKRQLIVNTTSASGGSIAALDRPGRAVIAATKTGTEKNATVFARYWVEALRDPTSDVNKNDAISAIEAFDYASAKTAAYYDSEKRLATEHAVFEDTGKHESVRAASTETGEGLFLSNFTLVRLGSAQKAFADPAKRELLAKKEELEQKIDALKYQKAAMAPDDYQQQLTQVLVELAHVQEEIDQ
jgi:hypothetical protein